MTYEEAILILMRTEGNSVAAGYGPTDDEVREAFQTLGLKPKMKPEDDSD